jgi:hypothetical protein
MKTNTSPVPRSSNDDHPPLARDQQGNNVAVPDGAAAFALKRETRGRPKLIIGPDRQAVRYTLETTPEDVGEMHGAGTYRVYALNEVGTLIDYVTTIVVGGDQDDADDFASTSSRLITNASRGPGSDLRYALETLRETNRFLAESLKSIASSQADWVKGLAVARALPRNAPSWAYQAPPPPVEEEEEDDDEDDNEDGPTASPEAAVAAVQESALGAVAKIADAFTTGVQTVKELRNAFGKKPPSEESKPTPETSPEAPRNGAPATSLAPNADSAPNPMVHLAEMNEHLSDDERRFLGVCLRSADGPGVTRQLLMCSVRDAVKLVRLVMTRQVRGEDVDATSEASPSSPPPAVPPEVTTQGARDFMGHVIAVSAFLTAAERAAVLSLMPRFPADRLEQLKVKLLRMSPKEAAAWIHENLESLRAEVSS